MRTAPPPRLSLLRRPVATLMAVAALLALAATASRSQVVFYTTRATFNAAAPGLPVDAFSSSYTFQPYPNNSAYHTRPISSATNDALIPAGCLLTGLTITTTNPAYENQALKAESAGPNTLSIGTGTFQDVLVLQFTTPVSAIGADVFGHVYPGPVFTGNVEVTAYNGATQIGYFDPNLPTTGPGFVGLTSSKANITSVTYLFNPANDNSDANTFVTNVAFGVVPEPSNIAVYAIGSLLLLLQIRRKARGASTQAGEGTGT